MHPDGLDSADCLSRDSLQSPPVVDAFAEALMAYPGPLAAFGSQHHDDGTARAAEIPVIASRGGLSSLIGSGKQQYRSTAWKLVGFGPRPGM
jgi:hypothetical protein